ncbi:hypothetical protein [Pseudolysinimonas sp.]
METGTGGRGLEIATAVALGVVSLVTALGVLQSGIWNDAADRYATDSADARDQSISRSVVTQLQQRSDLSAILEAEPISRAYDAALEAGDEELALTLYGDLTSTLAPAYLVSSEAFAAWKDAGFPGDARPTDSPEYLVELRGDVDALILASRQLGEDAAALQAQSAIFGQSALVHALALFLFGVAGINRLRAARFGTLGVGLVVFLFGLFLMSTAY